jgi:hypothetical protein
LGNIDLSLEQVGALLQVATDISHLAVHGTASHSLED